MDNKRIEHLEKELRQLLQVDVEYKKVAKLNMTSKDAFICGNGRLRATIYFDPGWSDEFIVHNVQKSYAGADPSVAHIDEAAVARLNDREYVLEHVERSVIGTKLNKDILQRCVHREYLDLSVIYKVVLTKCEQCRSAVTITNDLAESLGLTMEDLEHASIRNQGVECYVTASMQKILVEAGAVPEEMQTINYDEFYPMYVISTTDGIDGASSILHTSLFAGLAKTLDSDLYILPSSVDELICVPVQGQPAYFFREMVASVNHSVVEADKILGSNVYIYKRRTKVISIAE